MSKPSSLGRPVAVPSNRAQRAARFGGMVLNLASSVAVQHAQGMWRGERRELRDYLLTPNNIIRVTNELARMRGAAMKLGQLISMDAGDLLPPELAQIMARLRADADFMPPAQLKRVLTQAWGPNWLGRFKSFNVRPIAAASIGQVHRATLKDGQDVAIKVQYPGVARSIDSDVANVSTLIKLSGLIPEGFEIAPYVEEARKQLHEETDYLLEAEHMRAFKRLLASSGRYDLPDVHDDLTIGSVLTMSYIESQPLEDLSALDQALRDQISTDLIALAMRELFEFRMIQSDPNFANFRFNATTGQLVLLDFGATRQIDAAIAQTYRDLIRAGLSNQTEHMQVAGRQLGLWTDTTHPAHVRQLTHMMQMLFDSICAHENFDFADQTLMRRMNQEGISLAESGFVPPPVPMDVLFVQRKLAGVFLIASNLKARLPLQRVLRNGLDAR
ncbi:MAG: AarF/ABC1/UbiB kinase family protein [Rhodobacteraceae bacterium]|nr:AarF/ABC1/UbiB kinase family protein [Paracoccaceae bacterium]